MQPNPEYAPTQDRQKTERAVDELRQSAQVYALDGSPYVEPRASANTQSTSYSSGLFPFQIDEPPSTGDDMSDPTREEIKEAIGAAEARGETKIARFEGKLDLVLSKLDDVRQDNRATRANQWVIGFGLAFLIVAMFSAFPAFFGIGSQIRDLVHAEVHDQLPAPAARTSTQK